MSKTPSIIYADLKFLINKVDWFKNTLEKLSTIRIDENIPCGMSTVWTFDDLKNKHNVYRGEDCMKKFGESLGEHAMTIINFEKRKMLQLINGRNHMKRKKFRILAKEIWKINTLIIKNIVHTHTHTHTHTQKEFLKIS